VGWRRHDRADKNEIVESLLSALPTDHRESFTRLFETIYKHDPEAVRVSLELVELVNIWDDLIDGDAVTPAEINAAFLAALCEIGGSYLWDHTAAEIARLQFFKWVASNAIEANPEADRTMRVKAFMLRAGFFDLFYHFAYKLHGMGWAEEVAPLIAVWYGETVEDHDREFWR